MKVMGDYKRYIKSTNIWNLGKIRMVNQPEIIDYLIHNPGKTENEIMFNIYGYDRSTSFDSNKKYADCLRRALYNGKINRVKAVTKYGKRYIYFVTDFGVAK